MKCKYCKSKLKNIFLDLGKMPLANSNLKKNEFKYEKKYILKIYVCKNCWLVQTKDVINNKEVFNSKYSYFSSVSSSWLEHAKKYVQNIIKYLNLNHEDFIIEIASNDGYLLKNFKDRGFNYMGIEPSKSTAKIAQKQGIKTKIDFFTYNLAKKISLKKKAKLIIVNNVYAHIPDVHDFTKGLKVLLSDNGVITLEFQHLLNILKKKQFDTVYHEHYYYYSVIYLIKIFKNYGLKIWKIDKIKTHGGSLRIYACHDYSNRKIYSSVKKIIFEEKNFGLDKIQTYLKYNDNIKNIKLNFKNFLRKQTENNKKVYAYGAPAKGNTFLNYCNIKSPSIRGTFDMSPLKMNKYLPGSHIKIHSPNNIKKFEIDYLIILPWNLKREIINFVKKKTNNRKIKFVTAIPSLKIE